MAFEAHLHGARHWAIIFHTNAVSPSLVRAHHRRGSEDMLGLPLRYLHGSFYHHTSFELYNHRISGRNDVTDRRYCEVRHTLEAYLLSSDESFSSNNVFVLVCLTLGIESPSYHHCITEDARELIPTSQSIISYLDFTQGFSHPPTFCQVIPA